MDNWESILHPDPIPWLLEDSNPSVRYFTLIDILDQEKSLSKCRNLPIISGI